PVIADEPHKEKQLADGCRVSSLEQASRRSLLAFERLRELAQINKARQIFNTVFDDPEGQEILYERFQVTRQEILLGRNESRNRTERHSGVRNCELLVAGVVQIDMVEKMLISETGERDILLRLKPGELIWLGGGVCEF